MTPSNSPPASTAKQVRNPTAAAAVRDSGSSITRSRLPHTIAKKKGPARISHSSAGAAAVAVAVGQPSTGPAKRSAQTASSVIKTCMSEFQKASTAENKEISTDIKSLRTEMREIREELIRQSNERKIVEEKERQAARDREEAYSNKVCGLLTDILSATRNGQNGNGSLPGFTSDQREPSLMEKADTLKDYVKLYAALELLDTSRGSNLFAGTNADTPFYEDGISVLEGAKFVLGQEASDEEIKIFLNEDLTIIRKGKHVKQRLGSYAAQGQCRAHDNIRSKTIDAFFAHIDVGHPLRFGSSSSEEEKQRVAAEIFTSGEHKESTTFDEAWYHAWLAAKAEAHSTVTTSMQNLMRWQTDNELPTVPVIEDNPTASKSISIFSLGFVIMKITKGIQGVAKIKVRGMRQSHGPFWAKEVKRLNDVLSNMAVNESQNDEGMGGGNDSTIEFGKLTVCRLMTTDEEATLSSVIN